MDIHVLDTLTVAGIYAILAIGLNVVVGYAGVLSVGQAAFFGVGAYSSALITLRLGWSPIVAMLVGCAVAGVIGWIATAPVTRLRDDYLLMATLGLGEIAHLVFQNWEELTAGPRGIAGIGPFSAFGFRFDHDWALILIVWSFVALAAAVSHFIKHSPFGRDTMAVRDDAIVAQSLGKRPYYFRAWALVIGAMFGSIAGSLLAHKLSYINSETGFGLSASILVFAMVILGGRASTLGPIAGAVVLTSLPEILRRVGIPIAMAAELRQMTFGILLVVAVIWRPRGLLGRLDFRV